MIIINHYRRQMMKQNKICNGQQVSQIQNQKFYNKSFLKQKQENFLSNSNVSTPKNKRIIPTINNLHSEANSQQSLTQKNNNSSIMVPIVSSQKWNSRNSVGKDCQCHSRQVQYNFCQQCLIYNICVKCRTRDHKGHKMAQYLQREQMMQQSREKILESIEHTLQGLKRQQNEIKNKDIQISLIINRLESMQSIIQQKINYIYNIYMNIINGYTRNIKQKYLQQRNEFYNQYNHINNLLRQVLIDVIDGKIQENKFCRQLIQFNIKGIESFGKFKTNLDKSKHFSKSIITEINRIVSLIEKHQGTQINKRYCAYDKYFGNWNKESNQPTTQLSRTLSMVGDMNQLNKELIANKLKS